MKSSYSAARINKLCYYYYYNSIKFEVTFSTDKVCFLDTITYITEDTIHTTVYTKPTDKKQYLYFTSSHPKHTARAIPFSQAIRFRRIIDNDDLLEGELTTLCSRFIHRGYPADLLKSTVDRVKLLSRDSVLQYKDKSISEAAFDRFLRGRSFLPLILPFHQSFEFNLSNIVADHWHNMLSADCAINNLCY